MYEESINSVDNLIKTEALIEQHLHGGFGLDFSNCSADDFIEFSKKILKFGVSGFFPTLATDSIENLRKQIFEIRKAVEYQSNSNYAMAKILGIHLEACFLNPEKKGIHDEKELLLPTIENYKLLEDDLIKIVTLAPELDEKYELCDYLISQGVRVSAGHCVEADLTHVSQVTHLYNAMGNFSHKQKNTVTSALSNDNIYTELIADYHHVQEDVLKITFKTKPLSKIILISDALPITHSSNDKMIFCQKEIYLKDGKAIDISGTMAGSTMFVSEIIKKLVKRNVLDLKTAVTMASTNINYIDKPNAQIFWDGKCDICAMTLNGEIITF